MPTVETLDGTRAWGGRVSPLSRETRRGPLCWATLHITLRRFQDSQTHLCAALGSFRMRAALDPETCRCHLAQGRCGGGGTDAVFSCSKALDAFLCFVLLSGTGLWRQRL